MIYLKLCFRHCERPARKFKQNPFSSGSKLVKLIMLLKMFFSLRFKYILGTSGTLALAEKSLSLKATNSPNVWVRFCELSARKCNQNFTKQNTFQSCDKYLILNKESPNNYNSKLRSTKVLKLL